MKDIEETFKVEKRILEEFFKNRVLFFVNFNIELVSKQIFKPEKYSLDFLKEKITPICYFLGSISPKQHNCISFKIELIYMDLDNDTHVSSFSRHKIDTIYFIKNLKRRLENHFKDLRFKFIHEIPTKPFYIHIQPDWWYRIPTRSLQYDLRGEMDGDDADDSEEENEEEVHKPLIIKANNIFNADECVTCLHYSPNVLFCNCGHVCICAECEHVKSLKICPICKTENTIKRMIE